MEALQWCGAGHILPSGRQVGGEEIREEEEEEKEEVKRVMVSTISFIQANLQHSIAASGILSRTIGIKGTDMALEQEPWYRDDCIRGLTIPGYTLYSARGKERTTGCILARIMNAWVLPEFSCRDLVALLIKCIEDGTEGQLVVCSASLQYDSEDLPPSREMEELIQYCENENLHLIVGCDSDAHHTAWGSTNCNGRGEYLIEFLFGPGDSQSGKRATFCNVSRQEVIVITLGSYGLLESIIHWEVSQEPSLLDHRHFCSLYGALFQRF